MGSPRTDLILDPERLDNVPVYTLLEAVALGYLGVDHRFLHAIVDHPEKTIPDLVRFAAEDRTDDRLDTDSVLLDIFRYMPTPEALPFLVRLVGRDPFDLEDDLVEAFVQVGAAAIDPLLELLDELDQEGEGAGEVPFLLSVLQVRDPRILDALTHRLAIDDLDTVLHLDFYGDPAAIPSLQALLAKLPADHTERSKIESVIETLSSGIRTATEPLGSFDIWDLYPKEDSPALEALSDDEHLALLANGSAEIKSDVAAFYRRADIPPKVRARLLQLAKNDPDSKVRGECWETLAEIADEPEVRKAMLAVLQNPDAPLEERGGVAIALAQQCDNKIVFDAIENLYANPRSRPKALKAMARSFDRRFAAYPPKHLDDPDPEIKRQAIWGIGYLNIGSEASRLVPFFDDDEFRSDALFAYAIAVPGETSRGRIPALLRKVDEAAGGFKPDEEELVEIALDQRLMLHGKEPFFSAQDEEDEHLAELEAPPPPKPGRNDPCPCGSGKKYKKCCGAS
ncbi:MAG TPA: SEC-C metal-binding domain-containing protein [Bryobacteraceae bacterium]|nr:SEC-C metal-binding domain-containing protein [Bryobacteraceae bacterium]